MDIDQGMYIDTSVPDNRRSIILASRGHIPNILYRYTDNSNRMDLVAISVVASITTHKMEVFYDV